MRRVVRLAARSPLLTLVPAACRQQPQGALKAVVIGGEPKLRDPALGPLPPSDAVLLAECRPGPRPVRRRRQHRRRPRRALERQRRWPELHLPARVAGAGRTARRSPPSRSRELLKRQLAAAQPQSAEGLARRDRRHRRDDRPGDRDPAARAAAQPPVAARAARIRDPSRQRGHRPVQGDACRQAGRRAAPDARDRRAATTRATAARGGAACRRGRIRRRSATFAGEQGRSRARRHLRRSAACQRVKLPRNALAVRSRLRACSGWSRRAAGGPLDNPGCPAACSRRRSIARNFVAALGGARPCRRARPCSSRASTEFPLQSRPAWFGAPLARPAARASRAGATGCSARTSRSSSVALPGGPGADLLLPGAAPRLGRDRPDRRARRARMRRPISR